MRLIYFFITFSLLSSCGTLRSPKNLIPIDSEPRGLDVYSDGQKVGVTPFFHSVEGSLNHEYEFKLKEVSLEKSYNCSFNWGQSILPSSLIMLFIPVGTVAGGVSLLTDAYTGGLFRCHLPLHQKTSGKEKEVKRKRRILPLPIFNDDQLYSKVVYKEWVSRNKDIEKEVVIHSSIATDFYERGITNFKDNDPKKIKRFYINEVASKYKATHFYYFPYKVKDGKYYFTPKLIDVFSLKEVNDPASKPFVLTEPDKHKNPWVKTILSLFKIIPNGLRFSQTIEPTVSFAYYDGTTTSEKEDAQTSRHPESFPKLISSLGLENVLHPQEYRTWDFTGVIYPWLSASSWTSDHLGQDSNKSVWISNYYLFLSGEITFHTPVGAFSGGIGYGVSYSTLGDSEGSSAEEFGNLVNVNLNYVAFISRNFYFKLSVDSYNPVDNELKVGDYTIRRWSEGSIGIGYYFPTLRKAVRELVNY
jgi:hypothetical protein